MMSRPVAGLACRIRIPVRQYRAVAVLSCEAGHLVRLVHREAGLSIDLEEFHTLETAEECRDRLAAFLDLPPLTLAGSPRVGAKPDKGSLSSRRRNSAFRARRPRFLTRRRAGADMAIGKIEGREIIARS